MKFQLLIFKKNSSLIDLKMDYYLGFDEPPA